MADLKVLSTREVVNNIKSILSLYGDKKKIYDADVSKALGVEHNTLTQTIRRDSLLCKEILEWCQNTGVSTDFVFFGIKEQVGG